MLCVRHHLHKHATRITIRKKKKKIRKIRIHTYIAHSFGWVSSLDSRIINIPEFTIREQNNVFQLLAKVNTCNVKRASYLATDIFVVFFLFLYALVLCVWLVYMYIICVCLVRWMDSHKFFTKKVPNIFMCVWCDTHLHSKCFAFNSLHIHWHTIFFFRYDYIDFYF